MATVTVTNVERAPNGGTSSSPISASAPTVPWWKPALAITAIAAITVIMWFAYAYWIRPGVIQFKAAYVPFAILIVVTIALERVLVHDYVMSVPLGGGRPGPTPAAAGPGMLVQPPGPAGRTIARAWAERTIARSAWLMMGWPAR